ncbi:uncharacterized protein F4812DRAFT_436102 [Daldinia caldariorum]|uniref:uncharacterized protein n=1 Tax=Daldinia caldariorum TaxID=326644 RepID=UPI00200846FE|nr:uncharacterized protein F4812DRAFT_436102 [Daldinia caldariorum]KAI1466149.1 hypothetical protein F4812DRAFT_436102 [Daldinia caldariorum]
MTAQSYEELIKSLCASDLRMKRSILNKPAKAWKPWSRAQVRVVALHFNPDASVSSTIEYTDASTLAAGLTREIAPRKPLSRSVYLLEGLSGEFVRVLGDHFQLHPSVFVDHERLTPLSDRQTGEKGGIPFLPSAICGRDHVSLKYHEPLVLSQRPTGFRCLCDTSGRHVAITRLMGEISKVGISRRKCTFWSRCMPLGGWRCLIICDPPIRRILTDHTGRSGFNVVTSPFNSGYMDFVPLSNQMKALSGPPSTSMMEDLLFYLENHSDTLNLDHPKSVRVFVEKIIASHFLKLAEFLQSNTEVVLWHLSRRSDLTHFGVSIAEELWSDVQSWKRRVAEYQDDLEGTMLQLGVPLSCSPDTRGIKSWTDSDADFRHLLHRFRQIEKRVNELGNAINTLATLAGNRVSYRTGELSLQEAERAGREARSVKALTVLGIVFLPLLFSASLFSMADSYLPGNSQFWVYFALSLPLLGFVIILFSIIELGYLDGETSWSLKSVIENSKQNLIWRKMRNKTL